MSTYLYQKSIQQYLIYQGGWNASNSLISCNKKEDKHKYAGEDKMAQLKPNFSERKEQPKYDARERLPKKLEWIMIKTLKSEN